MSWWKADDNFPDNPKVAALSDAAFRLHVSGCCYASRHETDGKIPTSVVGRLMSTRNLSKLIGECLTQGVWHDLGGEYEVHDFLEFNPSKAELDSKRDSKRIAGAIGAAKRWGTVCHPPKNAPDPTPRELAPQPPKNRGSRVPLPFEVTPVMEKWAIDERPNVDWQEQTRRFVDHWKAQPGQKGVKADWPATWRNWIRSAR